MPAVRSLYRIPLIFFALAACFGLLLRWHVVYPVEAITYPYVLHAHSHLMFLGWVTNVLLVFIIESFVSESKATWYRKRFYWAQALLTGMAATFPLQGYGVASIVLSTLHTALIAVFAFRFFCESKSLPESASLFHMRIALIYFLVSAAGPIAIGATGAMGLAQSKWYYLSVYYYLHFQYNGFFTFGVIAVLLRLLDIKGIQYDGAEVRRGGRFLAVACVPGYFLSTLWADPGIAFNGIGFFAAVLQVISFVLQRRGLRPAVVELSKSMGRVSVWLLMLGFVCYAIKLLAQWLSAFSGVAHLAAANRPYVMAYLHLVLIGTISLPLLIWYLERGLFRRLAHAGLFVLVIGFMLTEALLMFMPHAPLVGLGGIMAPAMLAATIVLTLGVITLLISGRKADKS
ncbi:MAG: hypothetical protein DIU61_009025 [Bacteroidota bacterium]|jgi:hypothetical protein|nr:MAG: hypothetical protein DIU61_15715 [Bacteroidota bacterium]